MLKIFILYTSIVLCLLSCKKDFNFGDCVQKPDETKVWKVLSDGQMELQNGPDKGQIEAFTDSSWVKTNCPTL